MQGPGRGAAARDGEESAGDEVSALVVLAGAGDEGAWRELIGLYSRRVYALAKSRCGRHDTAEEITQSVFATIATKIAGGPASSGAYSEMGRFESWLFRITMNRIRDEMRRQKRQAEPTDPAQMQLGGTRDAAAGEGEEMLTRLRAALLQLSDSDREIVELRHHAGMSFKQMADMLEEPLGTLLARHHRALRKIKDLMEGDSRDTRVGKERTP
ncbi:MAG: sigma-70 family RNA polymerase sigma factor [Phycisphaeraceae bacterium]|nr:sigma-70 family RNA polymerase sigma factor [Phycisphaeraceae bacterium]